MSRRNVLSIAVLTVFAGALQAQAQSINLQEGFAPLVERVMPSVVNIRLEGPRGRDIGAGSGFIISPDGLVATNLHVIEGAMQNPLKVRVELDNDKHYYAKLVGYDPHTDISVIKIDAKGLRPVTWGDSSKVRRGEFAWPWGTPWGWPDGLLRHRQRRGPPRPGRLPLRGLHPDRRGREPGQLGRSARQRPRRGDRHQQHHQEPLGRLHRPRVRHLLQPGPLGDSTSSPGTAGWCAASSACSWRTSTRAPAPSSAGSRPGRRPPWPASALGDVLVSINGRSVYDSTEAKARIAEARPGSEINLAVVRNGARREVKAKLATLPDR
jgi:S1-C subfamily serine protease